MAKKSTGASEINGFIAVSNEKPKAINRPIVAKKATTSSTKTSVAGKNVINSKTSGAGQTTKSVVATGKEVKKTETQNRSVVKGKTTSTTKPVENSSEKVKSKITTKPTTLANKTSSSNIKPSRTSTTKPSSTSVSTKGPITKSVKAPSTSTKPPPTTLKSHPAKPQPNTVKPTKSTPTIKKNAVTSRTTKPTSDTTTKPGKTSMTKPTEAAKTTTQKRDDVKKISTNKTISKKPPAALKTQPTQKAVNSLSNGKEKSTAPKIKTTSKPSDDLTPYTNSAKVLGKSGVSFNVTLGPAKIEKPKQMPSQVKTETDDVPNSIPAPPPLVKQGTFVKDDDDEPSKSSLPHIVSPDELKLTQIAGSRHYEEDDFEDYESDFENNSTESESSTYTDTSDESSLAPKQKDPDTSTPKPPNNGPDEVVKPQHILDNDAVDYKLESQTSNETNNYEYEDDFEDYSSDFEDDTESGFTSSSETSTDHTTDDSKSEEEATKVGLKGKVVEEERKLDSGNYDLKTSIMRSEVIKQSQLNYIKEAISRENTMFKDGMTQTAKSTSPAPIQIMNFTAAIDEVPFKKKLKQATARGKTLLNMIKLHAMSYHLFEMQPMSYDKYIKLRGNANMVQAQTQTKEDDVWEETQTDEIITDNKWTQCPIAYHSWAGKEIDWMVYMEDKRGYGTDKSIELNTKQFFTTNYNAKRLHNFISATAQIMTVLLEEETKEFKNSLPLQPSDSNIGFSEGFVPIYCDDIDFLKDRPVSHICFSPHFSNIILTCFERSVDPEEYLPIEVVGRWLICLWDIIALSRPMKILVASAPVDSVIFDCLYSDLVYAGLRDGIICLWDLSEPDMDHDHCKHPNFNGTLRSPTYCTFSSQIDAIETHTSSVISLRSTSSSERRAEHEDVVSPTTLYSMSEDGQLIMWTVVRIPPNSVYQQKIDVRISPWGRVRLALTSVHRPLDRAPSELKPHLDLLCLEIKQGNSSVLLGTNMGFVQQHSLVKFKSFIPRFGQTNAALQITTIELCPHDTRCFLAGVSDGSLRLHSEHTSRPLKVFTPSNPSMNGITSVKWSSFKAGLIVSLDQNFNLVVWDICKTDFQPVATKSFKTSDDKKLLLDKVLSVENPVPQEDMEKVVRFVLSTTGLKSKLKVRQIDLSRDIRLPYLGIVVSDATVHVHRFSEEFAAKGADIKNEQLNILQNYLDLLHK